MYEQIVAPRDECRIAQQMYKEPLLVAIPFQLWNKLWTINLRFAQFFPGNAGNQDCHNDGG
jgi:hypothetical protein